MTIGVMQKTALSQVRISHQDLGIERILRLKIRGHRPRGRRLEIAKEFDTATLGRTDAVNRHLGLLQSIEPILLQPHVVRGIAELETQLTHVERQAAITV